jgi:PAS domain-containing protein
MTAIAPSAIFRPAGVPVSDTLFEGRDALLANDPFMGFFNSITDPAAALSSCHRVVLTNDPMNEFLGISSCEEIFGSVPGDLDPSPGAPILQAQTRYLEVHGRVFFILTILASPAESDAPVTDPVT